MEPRQVRLRGTSPGRHGIGTDAALEITGCLVGPVTDRGDQAVTDRDDQATVELTTLAAPSVVAFPSGWTVAPRRDSRTVDRRFRA